MKTDFILRNEKKLALLLLALGLLLRLLFLGSLPLGLNQDEASAGYDAWAILHYGMDRNGNVLPILLESWGSGQNALYSYLAIPFIALLGLTEFSFRLPGALCGFAALVVFWRLARRCRGEGFGLCALLLLTVNPWHIMASRWALEANLLPLMLLLGIWLTVLSTERPWTLSAAAAVFALSLYAYGTAFFFLPFFLIFALFWLYRNNALRRKPLLAALGIFILIAFPISLCQLMNHLRPGQELRLLGLTLPGLTEGRQMTTSLLGGGGWESAQANFKAFRNILRTQTDGLPYNAMSGWGLYYPFGLPLFYIGLVTYFCRFRRNWQEHPMAAALLIAFICTFFIDVNINRINMLWLPMLYFQSIGLHLILCKLKSFSVIPVISLLLCGVVFFCSYFKTFKSEGYALYFPGLGQAIECAEQLEPASVYISNYVNQPYIFVLFYTQPDPQEFLDTADYINPDGAFRFLNGFGKYRFGSAQDAQGELLILHESESYGRDVLAYFGEYALCRGQS